jgi:hypothetical protein
MHFDGWALLATTAQHEFNPSGALNPIQLSGHTKSFMLGILRSPCERVRSSKANRYSGGIALEKFSFGIGKIVQSSLTFAKAKSGKSVDTGPSQSYERLATWLQKQHVTFYDLQDDIAWWFDAALMSFQMAILTLSRSPEYDHHTAKHNMNALNYAQRSDDAYAGFRALMDESNRNMPVFEEVLEEQVLEQAPQPFADGREQRTVGGGSYQPEY